MSKNYRQPTSGFSQMIRKLFLSSFVVFTFVAYVIHQRFTRPDSPLSALVPPANGQQLLVPTSPAPDTATASAASAAGAAAVQVQPASATPLPAPATPTPAGRYKNGTYDGPVVDAYYGLVRVEAVVQNGQLASVQFLQYPSDRRTSVQINSFAMPYLQQEALQAQSANVNLISGATLTSEAFVMSLDAALRSAANR